MEYLQNNDYKNIRILLVEDDIQTLKKLQEILKKVYSDVVISENGSEALKNFNNYHKKQKHFDLIISDLNMPKINGLELLEQIREIDEFIPFIFLTAYSEVDVLLKVIKLDIDDYLKKPIDVEELLLSINKIIKKKRTKDFSKKEEVNINIDKNLYWNKKTKTLFLNNSPIALTKKEIELLDIFFQNPGNVVNQDLIVYKLWEDCLEFEIALINLKNLISRIRKKVPELNIKNIYGLGYQIKVDNERI